jgi:hypothetical protein
LAPPHVQPMPPCAMPRLRPPLEEEGSPFFRSSWQASHRPLVKASHQWRQARQVKTCRSLRSKSRTELPRLLRRGLLLHVVLRTMESKSSVLARRHVLRHVLLLCVLLRTSELRSESRTKLWLRGRSLSRCWPACTSCVTACSSRAVRTSSSPCASLGTSCRSPCDPERSPLVSALVVSASRRLPRRSSASASCSSA